MRRLPVIASLAFIAGCRAPAIPAQPSPREYAVYSAWFEQKSAEIPPGISFVVDPTTLTLRQNELQFQECLPPRMEDVFDTAPAATLSFTSGNDWLKLSDGRPTELKTPGLVLSFPRPTEFFQVSRVAFTRSGYDAYLWIQHLSCDASEATPGCRGGSGALIHGVKSGGAWTFQDTICQIVHFPS